MAVATNPEGRQCWVCFGTDHDSDSPVQATTWVKPCKCRGSTQWVHQNCIRQWVEQKQRGQLTTPVLCPQCQTQYIISYPHMGPVLVCLETIDRIVMKAAPVGLATAVGMALYWNSFSYGMFTVYTVLGKEDTQALLEKGDPILIVVGVPIVPLGLIILNAVPWEERLLRLYYEVLGPRMRKNRFLRYLAPAESTTTKQIFTTEQNSLPSLARTICGSLLFPYLSAGIGKLFFSGVSKNWKRAIFGGITLYLMKAILKLYLRANQYRRLGQRSVLNHPENI